jgi:ABC-type phosphate/phosphonate transport system substrate-binding protein
MRGQLAVSVIGALKLRGSPVVSVSKIRYMESEIESLKVVFFKFGDSIVEKKKWGLISTSSTSGIRHTSIYSVCKVR